MKDIDHHEGQSKNYNYYGKLQIMEEITFALTTVRVIAPSQFTMRNAPSLSYSKIRKGSAARVAFLIRRAKAGLAGKMALRTSSCSFIVILTKRTAASSS